MAMWLATAVGLIAVCLLVIGACLYLSGFMEMRKYWKMADDPVDGIDAIFVHSGPTRENEDRAATAFQVWKEIDVPIVLLGRAHRALCQYLEDWGVPPSQVITAPQSVDTWSNVREAVSLALLTDSREWRKVAIVTSGYHMARIIRLYQYVVIQLIGSSIDFRCLRAASLSWIHIIQEPIWVILAMMDPGGDGWLVRTAQRRRREALK